MDKNSRAPGQKPSKWRWILPGFLVLIAIAIGVIRLLIHKTNGVIESSGQRRTYLLYVPPSYDPATPTPLVISIHGFVEWPAHQMQISHWNDVADEYGFIVVYPTGTRFPLRWRTQGQVEASDVPMDDVTFIADLIDKMESEYNIDPTRIYANGLSNGGGMSYLLACKLADRIAAIGTVSGAYLFPLSACQPSRTVPLITFHGTDDKIVPYLGGRSRHSDQPLPAIPDWAAQWAAQNGCSAAPVALPENGEVSGVKYTQCHQGTEVVFYTIHGGGHSWPGGEAMPKIIVGHTTQDIDATRVMWAFFQQYTLAE